MDALEDPCVLVRGTYCSGGISYINICNLCRSFIHVEGINGGQIAGAQQCHPYASYASHCLKQCCHIVNSIPRNKLQ